VGAVSASEHLRTILAELTDGQLKIGDGDLDRLTDAIEGGKHLFVTGAGRSGLAIRAFANRLLHLGFSVSVVGDITSPHTQEDDLLIVGSGSGETESLVALATKAKKNRVRIALVTMDPESTLGLMADVTVRMPGASPKLRGTPEHTSIQPMGSAFEQFALLSYDAVILELMERMGETTDSMFPRHANLE
jgi:6-phospho-3-hexuloisomerase